MVAVGRAGSIFGATTTCKRNLPSLLYVDLLNAKGGGQICYLSHHFKVRWYACYNRKSRAPFLSEESALKYTKRCS